MYINAQERGVFHQGLARRPLGWKKLEKWTSSQPYVTFGQVGLSALTKHSLSRRPSEPIVRCENVMCALS